MRKAAFLGFLIAVGILAYLYAMHTEHGKRAAARTTVYTRATADTVQVKFDLLTLARAEHGRFIHEGRYASLDELLEHGDIPRTSRPPYSYEAELDGHGFRIRAIYQGPPNTGAPRRISIDDKFDFEVEE